MSTKPVSADAHQRTKLRALRAHLYRLRVIPYVDLVHLAQARRAIEQMGEEP